MKNKLIKIISGFLFGLSVLSIKTNAYVNPGWHKHCQVSENSFSWEYVYPDGSFATGWNYIDGNWYYFDDYDCSTIVGNCWYSNGVLCGDISHSYYDINNDRYYFDNNGRMLHDVYVYSERGYVYWLDNNGHPHLQN